MVRPGEHLCPHSRPCIAGSPRRRVLGCQLCLSRFEPKGPEVTTLPVVRRCATILVRRNGIRFRCGLAAGHPSEHQFTERE